MIKIGKYLLLSRNYQVFDLTFEAKIDLVKFTRCRNWRVFFVEFIVSVVLIYVFASSWEQSTKRRLLLGAEDLLWACQRSDLFDPCLEESPFSTVSSLHQMFAKGMISSRERSLQRLYTPHKILSQTFKYESSFNLAINVITFF